MTLKLENWQKYSLLPIAFAIYILMSFNVFASDLTSISCPTGSTLAIYQNGSIHTDDTIISGLDCGIQDSSIFCQNVEDCSLFNGIYDIYVLSSINNQDWILSNQTIASSYENFNVTSNFNAPKATILEYTGFFSGVLQNVYDVIGFIFPYAVVLFGILLALFAGRKFIGSGFISDKSDMVLAENLMKENNDLMASIQDKENYDKYCSSMQEPVDFKTWKDNSFVSSDGSHF